MDILVLDIPGLKVNVESLSTGSEVGSNSVTDRQIVSLGGDWGGQGSAEWINHWWESAHCLRWLLEVLLHKSPWVTGKERELLVASHWVVSSSEKLRCDFSIILRLLVPSGG